MEFTDSGPGVQEASRVFDPFYTTKPVGKGTGLGLSICYGIVTEHGGTIRVRNLPHRGASFTIELPGRSDASRQGIAVGRKSSHRFGRTVEVGSARFLWVTTFPIELPNRQPTRLALPISPLPIPFQEPATSPSGQERLLPATLPVRSSLAV